MFSILPVQDIMAVSSLIPSIQQQRIILVSCRKAASNSHKRSQSSASRLVDADIHEEVMELESGPVYSDQGGASQIPFQRTCDFGPGKCTIEAFSAHTEFQDFPGIQLQVGDR